MAGTIPELDPLTAPDDADEVEIIDASDATMSASGSNKRLSWQNIKATLKSYFDALYAAATHNHAISNVTGLQTALDGKAASTHNHAISDVTGLQTALDGKAASSHNHSANEITSGTLDAARLPAPGTTTLGGVKRNTGSAGQFVTGIDEDGSPLFGRDTEVIQLACSDETTALTTGTAKVTFRMPYAMTLTAVRASVTTAPTGSTLVVDINEAGSSILSTKLSIDASEKTSTTAATAAVISDSALADDAEITIDIDQIGSTIAGAGLKVTLIGTRA